MVEDAWLALEILLGGSLAVISGVLSRITIFIIQIRGLITPLITTHEPLSSVVAANKKSHTQRFCEDTVFVAAMPH